MSKNSKFIFFSSCIDFCCKGISIAIMMVIIILSLGNIDSILNLKLLQNYDWSSIVFFLLPIVLIVLTVTFAIINRPSRIDSTSKESKKTTNGNQQNDPKNEEIPLFGKYIKFSEIICFEKSKWLVFLTLILIGIAFYVQQRNYEQAILNLENKRLVKGNVVKKTDGTAISGVYIFDINNEGNWIYTDSLGNFLLKLKKDKTVKIKFRKKPKIDTVIELKPDENYIKMKINVK